MKRKKQIKQETEENIELNIEEKREVRDLIRAVRNIYIDYIKYKKDEFPDIRPSIHPYFIRLNSSDQEEFRIFHGSNFLCEENVCLHLIIKLIQNYKYDLSDSIKKYNHEHIEVMEMNTKGTITTQPKEKEKIEGYIYFLKIENIAIKIGRTSREVEERKYEIDRPFPYETKLIASFKVDDIIEAEKAVHEEYAEFRIKNSEWFELPEEEIELIENNVAPESIISNLILPEDYYEEM